MNNLVNQKAMKNLFKLSILAAFTMVFAACANEEMEPVAPQMKTITVTLDEVATRTTLNDAHTGLNWVVGDKFGYFTDGTGGANNTAVEYTEGAVTYTIQVPVDATEIKAYYPYYDTNTATSVSLGMSDKQTQEAGGVFVGENYPMAAIATIDENNNTVLKFTPVASALAFNVYNTAEHDVTEAVKSITLTTSEKSYGYIAYDFTAGVTGTPWGNSITITMTEPVVIGNAKPADTKIGESQIYLTLHKKEAYTNATVVVETTVNTYTFEYATLDCTHDFSAVNLNLSRGTTPEPMQPLSGDYVIVATNGNGAYYAMSSDVNGSRLAYVALENFDPTAESYMTDDNKLKWTAAAAGEKYTFKNIGNSAYLAFAGSNGAVTQAEAFSLEVTKSAEVPAAYYVKHNDSEKEYWLAKNTSANFGFGFYTGSGYKDIYLVHAVADTREALATPQITGTEVSKNVVTLYWDKVTGADAYEVYADGELVNVADVIVSEGADNKMSAVISNLSFGTPYNFAVLAKAAADNVTYKSSGLSTAVSVTTEANQNAKTFVKVTSENVPTDWSGTYLITGLKKEVVQVLSGKGSGDFAACVALESEVQADGSILTDMAYACVVEKTTNGYSIKLDENYLGYTWIATTGNNYLKFSNSFVALTYEWTFSFAAGNGNVLITNVAKTDRSLYFNSGSSRFACYLASSKQQEVYLYRLAN